MQFKNLIRHLVLKKIKCIELSDFDFRMINAFDSSTTDNLFDDLVKVGLVAKDFQQQVKLLNFELKNDLTEILDLIKKTQIVMDDGLLIENSQKKIEKLLKKWVFDVR